TSLKRKRRMLVLRLRFRLVAGDGMLSTAPPRPRSQMLAAKRPRYVETEPGLPSAELPRLHRHAHLLEQLFAAILQEVGQVRQRLAVRQCFSDGRQPAREAVQHRERLQVCRL